MRARGLKATIAVAAVAALALVGCAESKRTKDEGKGTFIFGAAGAPDVFDPAFATDGETFRPSRQMYDTLISHKQGSADLEAALATKWTPSTDGKVWSFDLRKGVKFHDGTPFNADAVCFNFDRWYNMKGAPAQSQMVYYTDVFGGFAKNEGEEAGESNYDKCVKKGDLQVEIHVKRYTEQFPGAFALTSLSMSSPEALKKYDADKVTQQGDAFTYNPYANEHPTGTGPFKFVKYDRANNSIELERNADYWGSKAKVQKLVFKIISDEKARKQELDAGTIHTYDFPAAADFKSLKEKGHQVLSRPSFNIFYMGINQKNPKLQDLRVRQAIAYALNRPQIIQSIYTEGSEVAENFFPKAVAGYADDVQKYDYNTQKAKDLLAQAGATGLTLDFLWPSEVTRPYMPDPKRIAEAFTQDLQAAGFTVKLSSLPWNGGYLDTVRQIGRPDLFLLGWTGDFNSAANFVQTFFGRPTKDFGLDATRDAAMIGAIKEAAETVDADQKKAKWQQVCKDLKSKWLPAVPIAHSRPALAAAKNVKGLIPSPLTDERFHSVSVE